MKLALVGGGGVRAPLFVASALRRAERCGLSEIALHDIDSRKLGLFGALSAELARRMQSPVRITTTTDLGAALDGAAYAVTTVRPGGDEGRVTDERIALARGVLGQETTGPGGFAMALRSIPTIAHVAAELRRRNPDAWLFNFTNPAGLVAQALADDGFDRVIGICDGANAAQEAVAAWTGRPMRDVAAEVGGLNHLSYARAVRIDGEDVLPRLLADDAFLAQSQQRVFAPHVVRRMGLWLNEYLYYYYYADRAVAEITADARTRGEEVRDLNAALIADLSAIPDPERALAVYAAYDARREATYMHYARPDAPSMENADAFVAGLTAHPADGAGEGYAGVALNIVDALETGEPVTMALNLPNRGAIDGLRDGDVVETSCRVDGSGIAPIRFGALPEGPMMLVAAVKRYERLAVEAIRRRSRDLAVEALVAHPLVLSYSRAEPLVDGYLAAHAPWTEGWS